MEEEVVQAQEAATGMDIGGMISDTPAWMETIQEILTTFGLQLIAAIVIFVIGRWVARLLKKIVKKIMERANVDQALVGFATGLIYAILLAFVVLAALSKLGIQTTSFIAILGAAGLAIGLALQGSLANFAAGVLMLIFRPFKIGDYIEGAGTAGVVKEIHIFTTVLTSPDNKRIIIPNAKMMGDNITNYSVEGTRRIGLSASISYSDDIKKAKEVLMDIITSDERVLQDPAPFVGLSAMGDSSIDFTVRPWVKTEDYWAVFFEMNEQIKLRLEAEGMNIPFPQQDVHLYKHDTE